MCYIGVDGACGLSVENHPGVRPVLSKGQRTGMTTLFDTLIWLFGQFIASAAHCWELMVGG